MVEKWLFDTDAEITCMSSQQFRLIPIERRPRKLNLNKQKIKDASRTTLIVKGSYLFPMQWNRKSVMRAVTVFKKFLLPFIL
jgi:hypothetical protein